MLMQGLHDFVRYCFKFGFFEAIRSFVAGMSDCSLLGRWVQFALPLSFSFRCGSKSVLALLVAPSFLGVVRLNNFVRPFVRPLMNSSLPPCLVFPPMWILLFDVGTRPHIFVVLLKLWWCI